METKAAGINPALIERSRISEVEDLYDALRGLAEDAFNKENPDKGRDYETYQNVTSLMRAALGLAGRSKKGKSYFASMTRPNLHAAGASMRLESRVAAASDKTLEALRLFCSCMEWSLETSRSRRAVVLNAIPDRVRQSRVIGSVRGTDVFEFLEWEDNVAEEANGILLALWGRLHGESERRAERAESAA